MTCNHNWELIDDTPEYTLSVCMNCAAERTVDKESGKSTVIIEDGDGQIERDGMLFCGACGMLAAPGDENYDWCDHHTGRGCPYADEDDDYDDPSMEDMYPLELGDE